MITKVQINDQNYEWINVQTDDTRELQMVCKEYNIDDEVIAYSLDRNEWAHIEYDKLTETFILIYNVPNRIKIDNHYETIPMIFLIKQNQIITLANSKNRYLIRKMEAYITENKNVTRFNFLFHSLFVITDAFFPLVEEMDMDRKTINNKLKEKTTKQNLLSLSDLETGIVYFISASKQNVVLLEQLKTHAIYRMLDDQEKEQFEDNLIEARQLVEMTQLSSQILQQLSGTYNNILNNNLNDTMKTLTTLSILLTVPTIITGFFGMNMPLPFENYVLGWVIAILISIILWFALAFVIRIFVK